MKTKQDAIREGIRTRLVDIYGRGHLGDYFNSDDDMDDLCQYLHSQGVVIKVDSPIVTATANTRVAFEGYSAYESLI